MRARADVQDADGIVVLDDGHAQKAAREWWRAKLRREEGHDIRHNPSHRRRRGSQLPKAPASAANPEITGKRWTLVDQVTLAQADISRHSHQLAQVKD
jgi:hypothetical protein